MQPAAANTDAALRVIDALTRPDALREAWSRVRSAAGAPGADGVSIDAFKRSADARIDQLQDLIVAGQYVPSPLRRVRIPKASGGWRLLGIPTIADRIVQTACATVLQKHLAPSFSSRSFAYRPFLGPRRAGAHVAQLLPRFSHAVTADIEKFFDNVEHGIVVQQLQQAGMDEAGVDLVSRWIRAPIQDGATKLHTLKGIPQGAPISPVIANLYLTGFDGMLETSGREHVRYADDFIVLVRSAEEAAEALQEVDTFLRNTLRLNLKEQKTQYVAVREGLTFVGFRFDGLSWTIPGESVVQVKEHLADVLREHRREMVFDAAKHHNDVVRGWRNYYGGNSEEMDRQLEDVECWRAGTVNAYFQSVGIDPIFGRGAFETFVAPLSASAPRGTYGDTRASSAEEPAWPNDDLWQSGDSTVIAPVLQTHSTTRQLRSHAIAERQAPAVLTGRFLRIPTYGAYVTRTQSLLAVRRKKQTVFECPFSDLSHVSIESEGVCISTRVLEECARRRISITVSRRSGFPIARISPARSELRPGLAEHQITTRLVPAGGTIAGAIVSAKIANQRALLLYHAKYGGREGELRTSLKSVAAALAHLRHIADSTSGILSQSRTRLFLTEARAAALYWSAFAKAVPHDFRFTGRHGRGAEDLVNKLLNFGYWSLHLRVWSALEHAGLHPYIGLMHTSRRKTPGLVFDAMEEFRQPLVDRVVLSLLGRGSRLELNDAGELTTHTRTLAQKAFSRALEREANGMSMLHTIRRQAKLLARSFETESRYTPYRYIW